MNKDIVNIKKKLFLDSQKDIKIIIANDNNGKTISDYSDLLSAKYICVNARDKGI